LIVALGVIADLVSVLEGLFPDGVRHRATASNQVEREASVVPLVVEGLKFGVIVDLRLEGVIVGE